MTQKRQQEEEKCEALEMLCRIQDRELLEEGRRFADGQRRNYALLAQELRELDPTADPDFDCGPD